LSEPDAVGAAQNPASGASVRLYLQIDRHTISRATFQSQGCTATIAASSLLTEMLTGCLLEDAEKITREDVEAALGGLPSTRKHSALLAEDVVRSAILDFQSRVT